jgi:HAD superfamily hydrolase (TIGR01509 family)
MKAYIFDLDGTLIDSMGIWKEIDRDFLEKRGLTFSPEYSKNVGAMNFTEAAEYTINLFALSETVSEILDEWSNMALYAYGNTIGLKPGARDFLCKIKAEGAKIALATSSTPPLCGAVLQRHGLADLFDTICFAEEVGCGKTKPDIFLLAAERLNVNPADCIVFDDMLAAIKSAKSIGMTVCGVYDEHSKYDFNEIRQLADAVVVDWLEVPAKFEVRTM